MVRNSLHRLLRPRRRVSPWGPESPRATAVAAVETISEVRYPHNFPMEHVVPRVHAIEHHLGFGLAEEFVFDSVEVFAAEAGSESAAELVASVAGLAVEMVAELAVASVAGFAVETVVELAVASVAGFVVETVAELAVASVAGLAAASVAEFESETKSARQLGT